MRGRMQVLTRTVTVITKPQLAGVDVDGRDGCISSSFITKPQLYALGGIRQGVVSHPYSSPNHNARTYRQTGCWLYLILIHHQTTTARRLLLRLCSCISSLFITKPQPDVNNKQIDLGCISSLFITKPQLYMSWLHSSPVVSHPYSSPNHN